VVAHAAAVRLHACEFRVRPGGLARCRREGRKNVHAFVVGQLLEGPQAPEGEGWAHVTYDPFADDAFTDRGTGRPVWCAREVLLTADGRCMARA
jgi:hypothetical protein